MDTHSNADMALAIQRGLTSNFCGPDKLPGSGALGLHLGLRLGIVVRQVKAKSR